MTAWMRLPSQGKSSIFSSLLFLNLMFFDAACVGQTIYKYLDAQGNTVYSDKAPTHSRGTSAPQEPKLPPLLITQPVAVSQTRQSTPARTSQSNKGESEKSAYSNFGNSTRCKEYQRKIADLRRDLQQEKYAREHLLKQMAKFQQLQSDHGC